MTKLNFNQAVPFEPTHVGEVIKDELAARDMKQSELSGITGIQKPILNDVIKGKRSITPEMALLFEKAIGIPATFLMGIKTQYELDNAKRSDRVVYQTKMLEIWDVLKKHISVPFFKRENIVRGNIIEDVKRVFSVFGIDNLDDFFELKAKEMTLPYYYRKSEKLTTGKTDIFTWKYYCYYLSNADTSSIGIFCKNNAGTLTKQLNDVFMENRDTEKKTREVLSKYGIRFFLVKKVGQVPVDGMSFWIGNNPTIVVTERIPSIDNFAFTVLHEVGHIYKHLDRGGSAMININEDKKDAVEKEADEFALNAIVLDSDWEKFMAKARDVAPYKIAPYIKDEAERLGVNPQILFGRYKHDIGMYKIKNSFETKIM